MLINVFRSFDRNAIDIIHNSGGALAITLMIQWVCSYTDDGFVIFIMRAWVPCSPTGCSCSRAVCKLQQLFLKVMAEVQQYTYDL